MGHPVQYNAVAVTTELVIRRRRVRLSVAASVTAIAALVIPPPLAGKVFVERDLLTFCATPPRVM